MPKEEYAKLENGELIKFSDPLKLENKTIFNPSKEEIFKAGFKVYKEEPLDENKEKISDVSYEYLEDSAVIYKKNIYKLNKNKAITTYQTYAQEMMDNCVKNKMYDNIVSACSYFNSSVETFRKEGRYCSQYRDSVWQECYSLLDKALSGEIEIPTKEEFLNMLPKFDWTEAQYF